MTEFIEAIARNLKTTEKQSQSVRFLDDLIGQEITESSQAIVIRKGNVEIRLEDDKIEIICDRLMSTKLSITNNVIEFKWRNGTVLNLDDMVRVRDFFFRENQTSQQGTQINAISPLAYDPNSGNLAIALNFPNLVINPPNTATVALQINALTGGSNNLEVRRGDGTMGFSIYNSGSIEVGAGSFYRHSGAQILGARRVGWSAMTGVASRSAIATSTATTPQVAEHLKALIDDLIVHGIIGN